jgi:hypothetical protein
MSITLTSTGIVIGTTTLNAPPTDHGEPISVTTFTSSGTYTVPGNSTKILVQMVGGGGGSAGYCESGGGGGYAEGVFAVSPGTQYSVTIGGGGGGVGYYGGAGSGGTSSFGSLLSASGGGGANTYATHAGGHGGLGSGGQINLYGGSGTGHCNGGSHNQDAQGGNTFFGGSPSNIRHNPGGAVNFGGSPGAGAAGNETDDGYQGSSGQSGVVLIYAFQ